VKRFGSFFGRWYGRLMRRTPPMPDPQPDDPLRQLTPEECARLSSKTQDLPYPLSVTDAEQIEEEVHRAFLKYGTAHAAAVAMVRRIAEMKAQKAQLLNTLDDCSDSLRQALVKDLVELNRRIADTEQHLKDYRLQEGLEN